MISRQTIEKVLQTADIVDVIGEFVNLKRSGSNYKGLCPFHKEKTPSFVVSPAKQIFKCFGCGAAGNVVTFLMKHEHLTFTEAIRWLAKKYNIPVEEEKSSQEQAEKAKERESVLNLNKFAQKFFTNQLFFSDEGKSIGLSYLRNRGFSDETILKFQLGFSPSNFDAFTQYAINNGYKLDVLAKAGLTIIKEDKIFDRFRERVIFPIHSMSGQILGFAGRTLRDDKSTAKYLNSPESEFFQKRKILYGLFWAKSEITKLNKCYLVEGYTDVMAFHQAGITNTVASLGTSLTEDHVNLIHRLTDNLTLIFDGDNAGIKAALRGIDIALKEGLNLRVVALPQGEDPDSFSKKLAPVDLKEYIQTHETDFITFKANFLLQQAQNDPIKKADAIKQIIQSIAVIPDSIKQSVFIEQAAKILNINPKDLYAELKAISAKQLEKIIKFKFYKPKQLPERQTPTLPQYINVNALAEEKEIIYYLLKFGDHTFQKIKQQDGSFVEQSVAEYIITELQNENLQFKNTVYQKIFLEAKQLLISGNPVNYKYFISHPDPQIQQITSEILAKDYELSKIWKKRGAVISSPENYYKKGVYKAILAYKLRLVNLAMQDIIKQMQKTPPSNLEQLSALEDQYQNLFQLRSQINSLLGNTFIINT